MKNEENKTYPWYKFYKGFKANLDYPKCTMYELIYRSAQAYPSYIAYSYYGNKVTYRSFMNKIDEAACAFIRMGVKKGDYVSIAMPNTPEAIVCFYALNKLGAICNMIHPLSSEEEFKHSINLVKSKYLMVADIAYAKIKNIRKELTVEKVLYTPVCESMDPLMKIGYKLTAGRGAAKCDSDALPYYRFIARAKFHKEKIKSCTKAEDTAVILHSGGTTGKPKGIELTNYNMNSLALSGSAVCKTVKPGEKVLAIMPIFHGFGLGVTIHVSFINAAHAMLLPSVSPKTFDETIMKYKPNLIACVPSLLETLPQSKKLVDEDLSYIKDVIVGGDSISRKTHEAVDEFLYDHGSEGHITPAFGLTECSAGCCMMPKECIKKESVGVPLPDAIIKIVDPKTNKELPYGQTGEIIVHSPTVMKGYFNDPEETNKVLIKREDGKIYLHTGDLGYMDKDGYVFFQSRQKRMIVSSGYNIYPGQIEEIINKHKYVKACVAVGVPHPYKKEVVKVYIVLKDDIVLTSEVKKSIKTHCEKNIAKYALPYAYGYRKELPRTKIGKVAYRDLIDSEDNEE